MLKANEIIKGRIIGVVEGEEFLTIRHKIFKRQSNKQRWQSYVYFQTSGINKVLMFIPLMSRLFRLGIHHVIFGREISFTIYNKSICFFKEKITSDISALKGSRPLAICQKERFFYYGEYHSNSTQEPVNIWKSAGKNDAWVKTWTFEGVRHIHGVFYDDYSDAIWITTGDSNDESGIWVTYDDFLTVKKVVGGAQMYRAVQLLFTQDYIYFGSDAPEEQNFIYRMTRNGLVTEQLQAVGSSVFYGCKVGDKLFLSTAIEPSQTNTTSYAEVWCCEDGENWYKFTEFKKDALSKKYFQYGQVLFPTINDDRDHLYITPFATNYHNKTLKYKINS
jgi:hypothetical protein